MKTVDMIEYAKEGNMYVLRIGGAVIGFYDEVAIAISITEDGTPIIYQHGSVERVFMYVVQAQNLYRDKLPDISKSFVCITSRTCSPKQLNLMISDQQYLITVLNDQFTSGRDSPHQSETIPPHSMES